MIILNITQHPKQHDGIITLGAGHSLIVGHGPKVNLLIQEQEAQNRREDLNKFGLFEVATPNFNTYYPDVTEEDLAPKEGEFIRPLFRALSEVVVRKNFDPVDFTKNGVLKASMNLLLGQTIYTNHEAMVGNEVGTVSKTFWSEATEKNGKKIPAGINAEFLIDGKAHPKIARAIMMDPPSIHSNSVTVNFKWEQSHPNLSFEEFRSKVGTYDNKGQLIRRVATEIKAYYETSLVSHGADPYAQKIGADGKIVNPGMATRRDSFSANIPGATIYHFFSYKEELSDITIPIQLDNNEPPEKEITQNNVKMKKETILLMALLAGYQVTEGHEDLSQEEFEAQFDFEAFEAHIAENQEKLQALTQLEGQSAQLQTLTQEKEALETEVVELRKFKNDNKDLAEEMEKAKSASLAEVQRLYSIAHGKDVPEKLLETFQKSDFETLHAFKENYDELAEGKYQFTCNDCNSHNVTRASSQPAEEAEEEDDKGKPNKKEKAELYYRVRQSKRKSK